MEDDQRRWDGVNALLEKENKIPKVNNLLFRSSNVITFHNWLNVYICAMNVSTKKKYGILYLTIVRKSFDNLRVSAEDR